MLCRWEGETNVLFYLWPLKRDSSAEIGVYVSPSSEQIKGLWVVYGLFN